MKTAVGRSMLRAARALCCAACTSLLLSSCGSSPGSAGVSVAGNVAATLTAGGARTIYLVQAPSSILELPAGASGSVAPAAVLTAPITVTAVATDGAGELYVGGFASPNLAEVLVYPAGASGAATPIRTILSNGEQGNPETLQVPVAMTVGANGMLYVLSTGATAGIVEVFSASANGYSIPTSSLDGGSTGLYSPLAIAVDAGGNIYVSNTTSENSGSILVFASGASGGYAPARVINSAQIFWGVAVDAADNLYAVENAAAGAAPGSIVEFAAGAIGVAKPVKTISGSLTAFNYGGALAIDGAGNLYVANQATALGPPYSVDEFGPNTSGDVVPAAVLSSPAWLSGNPGIAVH